MQRTSAVIIGIAVLVLAAVIGFVLFSPPSADEPEATASAPPASPDATASESTASGLLDRRWNVLYVGTDLNTRREAAGEPVNADAIMLVSLSADQSQLTLVSLPRDTVEVPLPDGGTYDGKVNALYREQGMEALVGAMETLFGVPIDAHVKLDMDDFAALVGAVGGVEVSPDEPIVDPIVDLDLEPGTQMLGASEALGYVRTRIDQDYGRMGRQQEVLQELVRRLVAEDAEVDLRSVLDGLDSLETDLPLDQLGELMEVARRATSAQVTELVISPPLVTFEGDRDDGRGYVLEIDEEAVRTEVQGLIAD